MIQPLTESRFASALAGYLHARKALNSLPSTTGGQEEQFRMDAYGAADRRLIATPAETLEDLRAKAEVIWQDANSTPREEHFLAFFADLRRLTANSPSRTFDPSEWLANFEDAGGGWVCRDGEIILFGPQIPWIEDAYFELETRGGRDAVNALIRERAPQLAEG